MTKNSSKKWIVLVIIAFLIIGSGYTLFKGGEYTSIQDKDYPKLISGGLTKDEVGMALGNLGMEYQDKEVFAQENGEENSFELSKDQLQEMFEPMCGDDVVYYALRFNFHSVDYDNLGFVYPIEDLNKFRSFWNVPLYEENTSGTGPEGEWFTDYAYFHSMFSGGDGSLLKEVNISKAEYKDNEMKIHFEIRTNLWPGGQNYKGSFVANLERKEDNHFALVDIDVLSNEEEAE